MTTPLEDEDGGTNKAYVYGQCLAAIMKAMGRTHLVIEKEDMPDKPFTLARKVNNDGSVELLYSEDGEAQ